LSQSLAQLKLLLGAEKEPLTDQKWDFLQDSLDQILERVVQKERTFLPVLSVCAEVAPLLGLFGTIWGLVHSFIDISQKRAADITVIAPGIAEALMTTLGGLLVAIPALVMFHYLSSRMVYIEQKSVALLDRFVVLAQKLYGAEQNSGK